MKRIGIIIVGFITILIICIVYSHIKDESSISYKDNITINVGESIPTINNYVDYKDISKVKDIKINWGNIKVENDKIYYVGKYNGSFIYNKKKFNVKLNVIDKISPKIIGVKDIEIYEHEKIDLLKNIKVEDNSHEKIEATVEGDYDINKKGEYILYYVAIDSSNNIVKEKFKLKVKEKITKINSDNKNMNDITLKTSKGYIVKRKNGVYYIDGVLITNKTYSLPSTYAPGGLLRDFTINYNQMKSDALKQGINLKVISGYRSYNTQKTLYNNYVKRDGKTEADRYSARAGHSEHQTGLAADINSLNQNFINTKEGKWLNENCYKYGFIIRYPNGKDNITGYMYEPWHIRYVGNDISAKLYNGGNWITLEEYFGITSKY